MGKKGDDMEGKRDEHELAYVKKSEMIADVDYWQKRYEEAVKR